MDVFVGIDLAWGTRNRTGIAAVDNSGRLLESGVVRSDDDLATWLMSLGVTPVIVGIDAPLVVPNATGQRRCENLISRAYGRYHAGPHSSSRANPIFDPPRAAVLAERFGWDPDPGATASASHPVCLEIYPHAGMVGLFRLGQRVLYKKGPERVAGFRQLFDLLETISVLRLGESARWEELRAIVADPQRGDLTRIEDEVDAIFCAHLGWLWHHEPGALQVYGTFEEGYIVAPPPPTHPITRA